MTDPYSRTPRLGPDTPDLRRRLDRIWRTGPGLTGWIGTVFHKEIGLRYLVTAFAFLLLGGLEALALRVQLARPDQSLLTPSSTTSSSRSTASP
ncbi:hypothetical protein [Rhodobacter sp. NSM]|uniref:hypothetical protein n=1 Tax=Rhodobacter sp. NSM TaxID=3457501 RepID=UPI003FD0A435